MKKGIFALVLLLVSTWFFWPEEKMVVESQGSEAGAVEPKPVAAPVASAPAPQREPNVEPKTELQSLATMSHTLGQISQGSFSLRRLLEDLQKTGQQPLVARDANPDTGEMLIVRTKSPLPGTRYFHAQYFTGDGGEHFVQHMSFEFKPGPDAMAEAIAAVEKNFPHLTQPLVKRDDYVKWNLDRDYIVWVKKMTMEDLQDDPFNSYSASDDGTIRIAVELDVHGK